MVELRRERLSAAAQLLAEYPAGEGERSGSMSLFMDVHNRIEGLTPEAVAAAHAKDLAVQEKYGVRYLNYWYDEVTGKVFCLAEAPSKEAAIAVHREANGIEADEIFEVKAGS